MAVTINKRSSEMLRSGDKITVAITHEISINRDKAWVRYEATSTVDEDEHAEDAKQRVIEHCTGSVVDAAQAAAQKVLDR